MLSQTREPKECFVVKTREITTFYSPAVTKFGNVCKFFVLNKLINMLICRTPHHRIKISNRRATQRCNVSSFFYAKICSLLARRRSSQPVQRVYWPENVIDWLGKWRPTCVMQHARWPFYMNLYSMPPRRKFDLFVCDISTCV